MNIDSYIKNMPPELQEKARACGSAQELLALAREAKVPVPDEALEAIAGGDDPDPQNCDENPRCPHCGSTNVGFDMMYGKYECEDCGYMW